MSHPSVQWARTVLSNPLEWAILDTETTGFSGKDEVVQIGIYGVEETVLLDSLIKPRLVQRMPSRAYQVHRISMEMLAGAPNLSAIEGELQSALQGRRIIAYNAPFDARLLAQSAEVNGIGPFDLHWECAMKRYTQFSGSKRPLQGGDHSAIGDCIATLNLIKKMAV